MKIGVDTFKSSFVQRAPHRVPADEVRRAVDSVNLTQPEASVRAFDQVALAVAAAVPAGGLPALAALAQEVGRSLVTAAQEQALADSLNDAFQSRFVANDPRLEASWKRIQALTGSTWPAPQQVNSPLVYAQSDSRNLYVGSSALASDLADESVLTFTLAHEEGHRQNRDTAGAKGLEVLLQAAQSDEQLAPLASAAWREGRHHNELMADAFAGAVAAQLGCQPEGILRFLISLPEDSEHPDGRLRARVVRQAMAQRGVTLSDSDWDRLAAAHPLSG